MDEEDEDEDEEFMRTCINGDKSVLCSLDELTREGLCGAFFS